MAPTPRAYHVRMRPLKAAAVALLAITATPLALGQFASEAPAVVPSTEGWERISGDLEFEKPRMAVRYEFYVNPRRPMIYEVVRYRVTEITPGTGARGRVREKLQWDRDGRDLRRFECFRQGDDACAWKEMEKGGDAYLGEVALLMQLYNGHNLRSK